MKTLEELLSSGNQKNSDAVAYNLDCLYCGNNFTPKNKKGIYCCDKCRNYANRDKKNLLAKDKLLLTHSTNLSNLEKQAETTKQTAIKFANWLDKLEPSQRVSVWSKNGECKGLFTMDNEQLFEKFEKHISLCNKIINELQKS